MTRIVMTDFISDRTDPTERALAPINPRHFAVALAALAVLGCVLAMSTGLSKPIPVVEVGPNAVTENALASTGRAHLAASALATTAVPRPRISP